MAFKIAERTPADGPVSVTREGDRIRVTAETDGNRESILITEYNAARILGLLTHPLKEEGVSPQLWSNQ